jgi:hypothetical protein
MVNWHASRCLLNQTNWILEFEMSNKSDNVIRLYDVKPELALQHLNRTTGLNFEDMPQSLAGLVTDTGVAEFDFEDNDPPILTDVVALPG